MRVRLLDAATDEMLETARYYQKQVDGLGQDFLDMIDATVEQITVNPSIGSDLGSGFRKFSLRRFPFTVIYRIEPDETLIVAIAHQRRRSGYWRSRV